MNSLQKQAALRTFKDYIGPVLISLAYIGLLFGISNYLNSDIPVIVGVSIALISIPSILIYRAELNELERKQRNAERMGRMIKEICSEDDSE